MKYLKNYNNTKVLYIEGRQEKKGHITSKVNGFNKCRFDFIVAFDSYF